MKTVYFRAELLVPHESVPALVEVGNGQWRDLVKRVADLPETHEDALAFSLMMIRIIAIPSTVAGPSVHYSARFIRAVMRSRRSIEQIPYRRSMYVRRSSDYRRFYLLIPA